MTKPIAPKSFARSEKAALDEVLLQAAKQAAIIYIPTYHNWEEANQPDFKVIGPATINGSRVVEYSTTDTPYVWVDNGTDGPYDINANASMLTFKPDSKPKTQPGKFGSMPGFAGSQWRSAEKVIHPGIEPRKFTETAAKLVQPIIVVLYVRRRKS